MLYSCCSNPKTCKHPKPTLQDWWALAYCYYPRTVNTVEVVAKCVAYLVAALVFWFAICIIMNLDVLLAP